jgi:hypothetical protein
VCGLNTFTRGVQKAKKALGRFLTWKIGITSACKNGPVQSWFLTVARPRGFLTRFPVLPAVTRETQSLWLEKIVTAFAANDGAEVTTRRDVTQGRLLSDRVLISLRNISTRSILAA